MLNKYFTFYKVCREKVKLYNFIKNVYVDKIEQMEDSILYSNDLRYAVMVLENSKFINPQKGAKLAKTAKLVFKNHDLSKLPSATFAVEVLNALHLYADKEDADLYREIYKFYQKHPYLFDKNLISRLEYYFYQLAQKAEFEDIVQINESYGAIQNTRMFTPVALDLYNIKLQNFWNVIIRHDPNKLTSTATLTHKSGITLRIQGLFPNNYEDITDTKELISNKQYDIIILGMPPISLPTIEKDKKFDFINKITESIESKESFQQNVEQVFVSDYDPLIEELKKKLKVDEARQIMSGIQQGFEVPYTMESILYQFSSQKKQQKQPNLVLAGLGIEEKLKLYLHQIDTASIAKELSVLRLKWLNEMFAHVIQAQKLGCFMCGTKPQGIKAPSKVLDENPVLQKIQTDFISDITMKYIGSSGKNKFLLLVNETQFYEILRKIVQTEIIKNDFDIDDYRLKLVQQKLERATQNQQFYKQFLQFYEDSLHTQEIYKLCTNDMLDLNKMSSMKYKPGIQIRCGVRDLLF